MKTPKTLKVKETVLAKSAGGKITKNKGKGKNQQGAQVDAAKAKLGLQKAKDTVKVQDGKNLPKKGDKKNKVLNGNASPLNGSGGKKKKPAAKKGKQPDAGEKSPEVQLGLKIEKILESPKSNKKNKKKGKKNAAKAGATPEVQTPVAGSPGKGKNKKKKDKKRKNSEGSSPVAAKPAGNQQKKKQLVAPKPKLDKPQWDAPLPMGSFPSRVNAENAIKALLKHMKEHKAKKPAAILDEYDPLMVSVDFFKRPEGARKLQRVLLPHQILGSNPDIIFVATDDKKAKADYDESIEKHKDLFKSHGVENVSEIIPWRKLCKEHTQFEEKRKLANRADAFLIDSKLSHRWPAIMRKKFFRKKAPIPVRTDKPNELKTNVEIALRKVAVLLGGPNSLSVSPLFGNSKMNVKSLSDNLITVVTVLCDQKRYPGGQSNIRQITIRGGKTEGFPVFVSTASPNSAVVPKATKKKREVVEGEVTTAGVTVKVHPGGKVQIKSRDMDDDEVEGNSSPKKKKIAKEEDSDEDDSDIDDDDSEIDADLLDKFKKANKASEDESSEDEEEIEKAEQEFLLALRKQQDSLESEALAKSKKAGKKLPVAKAESSDDDDDDDLDDEDDSDVPDLIPAKKSKPQTQPAKKGKNAKQAPGGAKPAQNGVGKGKPGKGKPGKQAQSPKGAGGKKGFQGGKGNANQKGNNKGSPKGQKQPFNKGGKKK
ncbi:hypothetical protein GE061_007551 [Apolygus lucorum]|uniref:Uncharacterized protein n=1 Tax=Apolygus lucorum TaxID=248454 RepID=A0A8S9WW27_APOLU|nr:hypothetical protein GE061_007551 [Apolygus lucorum]